MRRLPLLFFILLFAAVTAATQLSSDPRLAGSYKFSDAGWTYVHLQGRPGQIGFQHGYLLAREIEDIVNVYAVETQHD